jgi:hypothetical protein
VCIVDTGLVLYLGVVRRGEYESLLDLGLPLGVLVDTNTPLRLVDTSRFALVQRFDFSRPRNELVGQVLEIKARYGLSCLINMVEHYVAHAADVAAAVGVPGISPAAARVCLDKKAMRRRFQERVGLHSTACFRPVRNEAELLGFAREVGYPMFLQPDNLFSSLWSTRNDTEEELLASYREMQAGVPRYYEKIGQGDKRLTALASEFLRGANRSIDCFIEACGRVHTTPVIDVLTGQDIGIDDFHHFARIAPSAASPAEVDALDALARDAVTALGMTSCAAHVEFIGRYLGEAGARTGGNRPRILEMVYGIDAIRAYYQVLQGEAPALRQSRQRPAAIVTPFPRRRGILRAVNHLDELGRLPGNSYHEQRTPAGKEVGLARDGFGAPLYVELTSDDADEVRGGVDRIASWHDLFEVE